MHKTISFYVHFTSQSLAWIRKDQKERIQKESEKSLYQQNNSYTSKKPYLVCVTQTSSADNPESLPSTPYKYQIKVRQYVLLTIRLQLFLHHLPLRRPIKNSKTMAAQKNIPKDWLLLLIVRWIVRELIIQLDRGC